MTPSLWPSRSARQIWEVIRPTRSSFMTTHSRSAMWSVWPSRSSIAMK